MIKIGFVDYYLDEWHANNYPEMINNLGGGEFEVCCAYGHIDSPIGGITNKEWSKKYNIPLEKSIEKVIEKSDCIVVLSPDNPEMHEELREFLSMPTNSPHRFIRVHLLIFLQNLLQ